MTLNWECLCSKTGDIRHVEICPKLKNILLERETDFLSPRNRRSGNRFGIIRDLRACGYKMFFDIPTQATLRKDTPTSHTFGSIWDTATFPFSAPDTSTCKTSPKPTPKSSSAKQADAMVRVSMCSLPI